MFTILQWLQGLPALAESWKLAKAFQSLFASQTLSSAVLTGGASATVTSGAAFTTVAGGVPVAHAAGAALAALNGPSVPNAGTTWQAWLLTADGLGNFYTYAGTPAATLAGVTLPVINQANGPQAPVGFITMNNQSVGAFVPGTTLLNVAGLNLTLNNITGPFFPVLPT
jgi:hypothetical protein